METDILDIDTAKREINSKLPINILTLDDLKAYIKLRFRTYQEAGIPAGLSRGRARQIVNGFRLPKTPKLIYQIANGWNIDPIKLTLIFSNYNNEEKYSKKTDIKFTDQDAQKEINEVLGKGEGRNEN